MILSTKQETERFHKRLLHWFDKNQRDLPWRVRYLPYEIWISEIMLQQTRVDTVIQYFQRWMKKFPQIEDLAEASEEKVLKSWEGLGYYSRARNIHKTAKILMTDFEGRIPSTKKELETLPGVGPYTAGAISSIAFERKEAIIDGNIERVMSRVAAWSVETKRSESRDFFYRFGAELLAFGEARSFNQALMELGALICLPKKPKCSLCPVQQFCEAHQQNRVEMFPLLRKAVKIIKRNMIIPVIQNRDQFYLEIQPSGQLWENMWNFPMFENEGSQKITLALIEKKFKEKFGIREKIKPLPGFSYSVTKYKCNALPFLVQISSNNEFLKLKEMEGEFLTLKKLEQISLPRPGVKIREFLIQSMTHV